MIGACLVLLISSPTTPQPMPANLLPNPGFEVADGEAPAFWHPRTPTDTDRELAWVADRPHSGHRCLRITDLTETKSRWRTGHLRDIRLRPGSEARLTGWIRHEGAGSAYFTLYSLGTQGEVIAQPTSQRVTGDADWTQVSVSATVPDAAAFTMVYCENEGAGTGWYDDIELAGETWEGEPQPEPETIALSVDEFDVATGLSLRTVGGGRVAGVGPAEPASIEIWFGGGTACYDVAVGHEDEPAGSATLSLTVNGAPVPWSDGATARGVSIQRHSRVALDVSVAVGGRCRLSGVTFTCARRFTGRLLPPEEIALPPSLFCYPTAYDRRPLRAQLSAYVNEHCIRPAAEAREAALTALNTPEDWAKRQREVRAQLPHILGDFGEKCPLNPRIVGRIERDAYTIEKLIIESQPGYLIPCNLYIPKGRPLPAPGVLFTCGHSAEGKGYHLYHECCLGFVLKGHCVLAVEPMGQGERSEYFDRDTGKPTVPLTVSQHHQLLRPSWLLGRSLAGHRTWDLHRALDYLLTRPEVDPERLAVVGNSGGGQMALLAMAFDERLDVCAAAHPGGSCENVYLTGSTTVDRDILSLIAPRPCRFIVGKDSGEGYHQTKRDDMLRFHRGLGADEDRLSFEWVDGVHDMKQPKREAAYAWVNRWLGMEAAGSAEPPLAPEPVEALWCTEGGLTIPAGSESGQSLLVRLAAQVRPERPPPIGEEETRTRIRSLREAVSSRIGARDLAARREAPRAREMGLVEYDGIPARKLLIASEPGIELPAVLLSPLEARGPVVIHASESGKPQSLAEPSLPVELAKRGLRVLSADLRGTGEAALSPQPSPDPSGGYEPTQWRRDMLAANCVYGQTTLLAMCAWDLSRCVDWAETEFGDTPVVVVGEGLGGVWAQVATAFDSRIAAVVCRRTLLSYKSILSTRHYHVQGYFWVPGALLDYDLPELLELIAPRPALCLDAVDAALEPLDELDTLDAISNAAVVYRTLGDSEDLQAALTGDPLDPANAAEQIETFLQETLGPEGLTR